MKKHDLFNDFKPMFDSIQMPFSEFLSHLDKYEEEAFNIKSSVDCEIINSNIFVILYILFITRRNEFIEYFPYSKIKLSGFINKIGYSEKF